MLQTGPERSPNETSFFAAVASRLGLEGCEKVAGMAMRHMLFTYSCLYEKIPNLDEPLDGEDLSGEMLHFVRDLCRATDMLRKVEAKEAQREGNKAPAARQQKVTGQKVTRDEESDEETDGESSSKDSSSAAKQPSASKWLLPAKKSKLTASPPTSKSSPATKTTSPSASPQVSGKRSHHQKKQCPIPQCTFHGNDLRRHLNVHVKRGDVAADSSERLITIVRAGKQQRGKIQTRKGKNPIKGKIKRWCPVPGCDQIVLDVGCHLCNPTIHGMQRDSREYQRLIRMAKRYTGLGELQDSLVPPPPPIVELKLPREEVDG